MLSESGLGQSSLDTAEGRGVPCKALEPALFGGGYKMIESLEIQNFRCFRDVSLEDLKTVNLVVGRNASGKTAFLEALYFTLGGPALAFKLRTWRGLGPTVQYSEYTESRNAVWRDLFYNFEQGQPVKISFQATGELQRTVEIACRRKETHVVKRGKGQFAQITEIPPIVFRYLVGGRAFTVKPDFSGETVTLANSPEPARGSFFPSNLAIDPNETANHFSSLSKKGAIEPVVAALRELFPNIIEGLSLELEANRPIVHATLKGSRDKMPVGLISTGISKLVAYLVAIANQPGGIIIVDEIENGFYFSTMSSIWRVLRQFCKSNDVQLFASTHSAECLSALQSAVKESSGDFSLLRTSREPDGCTMKHFKGDEFLAALEEHFEVR